MFWEHHDLSTCSPHAMANVLIQHPSSFPFLPSLWGQKSHPRGTDWGYSALKQMVLMQYSRGRGEIVLTAQGTKQFTYLSKARHQTPVSSVLLEASRPPHAHLTAQRPARASPSLGFTPLYLCPGFLSELSFCSLPVA